MNKSFKSAIFLFLLVFIFLNVLLNLFLLLSYNNYLIVHGKASDTQGEVSLMVEGPDTISPIVTINIPQPITYDENDFNFNVSLDENGSVEFTLSSGITNYTMQGNQGLFGRAFNYTFLNLPDGSYNFLVFANDTSGNVNHTANVSFVVDTSVPAPSPGGSSGGGGGGGGGGAGILGGLRESFTIDKDELNIVLVADEETKSQIKVTNTLGTNINVKIEVSDGLKDYVSLDYSQLFLLSGESKNFTLNAKTTEPGIYAGRVVLTYGTTKKEIFVILNVKSSDALFDVSLSLPQSFKTILIGSNIKAFISLLQVGPVEEVDVTATYVIKDFDGNIITTESETFRVVNTKSYVKEFDTSKLSAGDYLIGIEIVYPQGFASSSSHFTVSESIFNVWVLSTIILSILSLSVIIWAYLRYKKSDRHLEK